MSFRHENFLLQRNEKNNKRHETCTKDDLIVWKTAWLHEFSNNLVVYEWNTDGSISEHKFKNEDNPARHHGQTTLNHTK